MMKKGFVILSFLLFALFNRRCKSESTDTATVPVEKPVAITAQYKAFSTFKNDTLSYISYNFVKRKAAYLNKPAQLLFNGLELPVKSYVRDWGDPPYLETINGVYLNFEPTGIKAEKFKQKRVPNTLLIMLKQPINYNDAIAIGRKTGSKWTAEAKEFYGKLIVEDIMLIDK